MLLQCLGVFLCALGLKENGSDVVWQVYRGGIAVNSREARSPDGAAAAVVLLDGKNQLAAGLRLQRLSESEDRPSRFAEFGIDGPAGLWIAIDGTGHGPVALAERGGCACQLNRLAIRLHAEFSDDEIRIGHRSLVAARAALVHGRVGEGFEPDGSDLL